MKNEILINRIKLYTPVILYCLLIFYISSREVTKIVPNAEGVDFSILHIPEYFVLSFLVFRSMNNFNFSNRKRILISILFSFIFGITDEIHQIFVPGRTFDIMDMIFNFIGSSLIVYKNLNRNK